MEELSLTAAFEKSIESNASELIGDLAEVGLDTVLEDGVLKEIPIIKTVISLYKIGRTIRDRVYVKQLGAFINEIRQHTINEEKRQQYINKFVENEKFRSRELEHLLVIISRYLGYEKPKMLAKIYLAYLDEQIDWNRCSQYSEIIDRFLIGDFETLDKSDEDGFVPTKDSLIRISSLGLLEYIGESHRLSIKENDGALYDSITEARYELTDFGRTLKAILFDTIEL